MKNFLLSLILVTLITLGMLPLPSNAYAQTLTAPSSSTTQSPPVTKSLTEQSPQITEPPTIQYTRYSVDSPGGQKALKSLQKALEIMRKTACTQSDSWYWQSAIHGVPGVSKFPQQNKLCPKYTEVAFDDPAQKAEVERLIIAWQHCTHNNARVENKSPHEKLTEEFYGLHFLPWHRLYLAYFEKIVRKLSGDDQFAIPYWDYTEQTTVPSEFVDPKSSLYERLRNRDINVNKIVNDKQQQKIKKDKENAYKLSFFNYKTLNKALTQLSSGDALTELRIEPQDLRKYNFTDSIDNSPHGAMHSYIGNLGLPNPINPILQTLYLGLMGDTVTAGFDPIFWVHHSNIDRYWESWTDARNIRAKPEDLPLTEKLAQLYTFSDEKGIEHTYKTAKEIVDAVYNKVDYKYDSLDLAAKSQANSIPTKGKITILSKMLEQSQNALTEPTKLELRELLKAPLPDERYLLAGKVSYKARPSGNYSVYLDLSPVKEQPNSEAIPNILEQIKQQYVGSINFFDVDSNVGFSDAGTETFAFDVSEKLKKHLEKPVSSTLKNFNLFFVSDNGPSSVDIFVESVALLKLT